MRTIMIIIFAIFGLIYWPFGLFFTFLVDCIGYILKPYVGFMEHAIKKADEILKESHEETEADIS